MTSAVVYAPFPDASARYRLIEPARVLGVPVVDTTIDARDADTIILNRPFGSAREHPEGDIASLVELWRAAGKRVVVDMDDDFDALPDGHGLGTVDTSGLHRACKAASAVVCSTPALVERYGYGHGVVVRNMVPAWYLSVERRTRITEDRAPWVGWYGSLAAHVGDPEATGGALGVPMREHGAELAVAGPKADAMAFGRAIGLDLLDTVHPLGTYSLEGLIHVVAEFDVGIVPLQANPFNDAKSWLKGLEMAAVGVPVIASPTREYVRAWEQNGCRLATDRVAWTACLRVLLRSPAYRAEHAAAGRAWAAAWTFERNTEAWSTAWYGA